MQVMVGQDIQGIGAEMSCFFFLFQVFFFKERFSDGIDASTPVHPAGKPAFSDDGSERFPWPEPNLGPWRHEVAACLIALCTPNPDARPVEWLS